MLDGRGKSAAAVAGGQPLGGRTASLARRRQCWQEVVLVAADAGLTWNSELSAGFFACENARESLQVLLRALGPRLGPARVSMARESACTFL